ncbi:MAG: hypothetical protein LM591_05185 [Candidatus Korarchaeum sp.]|jgi:hypothetical protein|nr:hypothetical protein [Candidatus Korarchaeum sp.]
MNERILRDLTEVIRRLKVTGEVDRSKIEGMKRSISELEDPILRKHLLALLEEIDRGYEEGDVLSKLISHESSEVTKLKNAILEFLYEEPFEGLDLKQTLEFWRRLLESLERKK